MSTFKMAPSMQDHVVKEIDICLAKGLAEKLYLFQYPVRPSSMTYDNTTHLAARMKPKQQRVELELGMDITASTYCFTRGEQIAHAVDRGGELANQKPMFPGMVMDRQVLSSVRATEASHKYAAAVYHNGVLHITPVKGIIQLRPGFNYFDKAEENNKKAAEALIAAEQDQSQSEDEHADAKPVQLRFAKVQNQNKKSNDKADIHKKELMEEDWTNMEFFQPTDRRSAMEQNLLYCHQRDFESPEFTATSRDYLKILSPAPELDNSLPAALPHGVLSLLKLKDMELTDQIKSLLLTAKVIQFSQVCTLIGGGVDENVVIRGLMQYAILVQGCWVVKSDVLYPKDSTSPVSGIAAEKLWPSRDFLLFCFNRRRILSRKEVTSIGRVPTEELREVLEQIARQRLGQGWEFMLNTDTDFLHKHPEACSSQASFWVSRYKSLVTHLGHHDDFPVDDWKESDLPGLFSHMPRKLNSSRKPITSGTNETKRRHRRSSESRRSSQSETEDLIKVKQEHDESPLKNETKLKHSPGADRTTKEKQNRKQLNAVKNISKDLRFKNMNANEGDNMATSSMPSSFSPPSKQRKEKEENSPMLITDEDKPGNEVEVEEHDAMNVDDIFIPPAASGLRKTILVEKPPSEVLLKWLRRFCRDTIRSGSVSLFDLKLILADKQKETGNVVCAGVNDDILVKAIMDSGAVEIKLQVEKERNVPEDMLRVFLYEQLNEQYDKFRIKIIEMFHSSASLRRKDILEKFNNELGESPTNHSYSKMLTEFCENHNGHWYLNGVFQTLQKYPV